MDDAFTYVKKNGGLDTEEGYPYEASNGKCRYKPSHKAATVVGYQDIEVGDEYALQRAVALVVNNIQYFWRILEVFNFDCL